MIDAVVGFTVDGKPDVGKTVNGIAVIGKANAKKYELSNHKRIKYSIQPSIRTQMVRPSAELKTIG